MKKFTMGWLIGGVLAAAGTARYRAGIKSALVRFASQRLPNPAKARGITVDFGRGIPGWTRITLTAGTMSQTLSDIVGYPTEAVAYTRFGGFNHSRRYSDFLNPDSPAYQWWLGVYIVFDSPRRRQFGFQPDGTVNITEAVAALEADQRLMFANAGVPKTFPDGRRVRLAGEPSVTPEVENGCRWQRLTGRAETWSVFHRGKLSAEQWSYRWCYGFVPPNAPHTVADLHPLTGSGEFWLRYEPAWEATLCKFLLHPDSPTGVSPAEREKLLRAGRSALANITFKQNGESKCQ